MSLAEAIHQFLVGRITFPAANYAMNRRGIQGRYRRLLATERASQEALRDLQFQKLRPLLKYAYERCPFYTQRFNEIGLLPDDVRTLDDFRRIPPLAREDVIRHRLDLVDARCRDSAIAADEAGKEPGLPASFARFRKDRLIRSTSTGSTGTPTIFYEDGSMTALNWVHEQRLKAWHGLSPGVKEARMKGISMAYHANRATRSIRQHLWNQLMLPGFFLGDAENEASLRKIRKFKPRVLWGPTQGLAALARHIRRTGQDISEYAPSLVISWAAPLYDHDKKLLGDVFGCPISNIYSTREVGHVAMLCPLGSIHVNQENYLVEIEGGGDDPSAAGPGQILVTPLIEAPMPFLRYRVGDVGEIGNADCPCGRTLTTLKRILGRTGDLFKTADGYLIDPNFWSLVFRDGRPSQEVEKFQVVYRSADCVRFRIVPRPGYSLETESYVRHFLEENFPSRMHFEFEYTSEILPQPSGKYLFVVNEIKQRETMGLV